ncbi:hypothetical protein [Pontibacillus salicampi]
MHQSHGIGYEQYSRCVDSRLKVEQRRQEDFKAGQRIVAEVDRLIHR